MAAERRLRPVWLLPALLMALGAAVVAWSFMDRQRVSADLDRILATHVESVSTLIRQGAREAAVSTDLIYALSEEGLEAAVRLIGHLDDDAPQARRQMEEAGLVVHVRENGPGRFEGEWGPVTAEQRQALVEELSETVPGEIAETDLARRLGLYCAHYLLRETRVVACKPAEELAVLRREMGIGSLLREVSGRGAAYAVIQDETGVLAASPGARVSAWKQDPELAAARERDEMVFRMIDAGPARGREPGTGTLFEGLGRFELPDGTAAVLRVGVDAADSLRIRGGIEQRHRLLLSAVGLLVLLSLAGAGLLDRWDKRRRQAELELAEREEENRRWQAIGRMAATVAHEVRNPLNTIKMAAQRLQHEFEGSRDDREGYLELVEALQGEADRVEGVVTDFLELGRPVSLELEAISCDRALQEAVLPLRLRAERERKDLVVKVERDTEIKLDRRRFVQIVSNLVNNALDAVDEGGTVTAGARPDNGTVSFVVEDDGPGMDPETLQRVQDPFVTLKATGTGLGLPLARRLAEAHGGTLRLSSEPGRGTRACLVLPKEGKG